MASVPLAIANSVRCKTVPIFNGSWALSILLPNAPTATNAANTTADEQMRFMDPPLEMYP